MKTLSIALGLALVGAAHAEEIRWSKDFAAGLATSQKTKRLIMLDFYTDW